MTRNLWQKKLKLNYNKNVLDIVQFGSSVIEGKTPNDIDIAVIFNKIPLNDQLNEAQKIKLQLQKETETPIHISSFDLYSLFDKSNFAKENILFYGKSLIFKRNFSEKFGFFPKIHLSYSLVKLKKKDKVRFNYALSGRGGKYGLIKSYGGKILHPGLIEILPEYEYIFLNNLKKISPNIKKIKVFNLTKD